MNLPAIAANTLQQFRNHPVYKFIFDSNLANLKQIYSPIARAKHVHKEIEKHLAENLSDPIVAKHVSCKQGCTACCHTQVSVSHDEAFLLFNLIKSKKVKVDIDKLALQSQSGNNASDWYKLDYKDRGCIFLDQQGSCTVYKDRPGVCRTNYSVSDPSLCSTEDGVEKPHRLLNTHPANMVLNAGYFAAKGGGALPKMLWELLCKKSDNKSRSKENFI